MGETACKLYQHYGCKVLVWYLGLCAIAVVAFILIDSWLGLTKVFNKGELVAVVVGLIAWTAAMIVPVAAFYAITDWKEQHKVNTISIVALDLMKTFENLLNQYYLIQAYASTIGGDFLSTSKTDESKIKLVNDLRDAVEELSPKYMLPFKNKFN
jgi:riboflavin transporter FmnP